MRINYLVYPLLSLILTLPGYGQDLLTLEQAIATALENNYAIQIVRNNERVAENNNTIGNMGFLPRVDVQASLTENRFAQNLTRADDSVVEGSGLASDNISGNVRLNWTIFDGFQMFVNRARLGQEELSANFQRIAEVANLVANVTSAYYAVVQQQKLNEVTRQAMELSRQRKDISDAKIRIGSGSRLMLLQSQVDFNVDSALLIQRLAETEKMKGELNRLINRDLRTDFTVVDDVTIDRFLDYDALIEQMKAQNPNLTVTRIDQELAKLDVKQWKAQYYPSFDLFAGYDYSENNFPAGFSFVQTSRRNGSFFGISLSWNIFNGVYVSPNLQSTLIEVETSELQYKENELLLSNDLYRAYQDYRANLTLAQLETVNLEVAKENVEIALQQYQLGVINDIDLRAIQLKQVESETNLLISQFLAKQSEIQLKLISGTLSVTQ